MAYSCFVLPIHGHEQFSSIYSHGYVVYFKLASVVTDSICIVILLIILIEILSSCPIICGKCLYYFPSVNFLYMLQHPFIASTMVEFFMDNIFKLHGMPHSIIFDRDTTFTSNFWREFFKLQGTQLHRNTAYHP
jgi:hypothetical protein